MNELLETIETPADVYDTRRILELLNLRHPTENGEWATFMELNADVGGASSRIDFYAISCWHRAGHKSIAYEVKISRADFARELRNPDKRKRAEAVAHETWFAAPINLIRPEELPEGWGLIEAHKGGLRVKQHAPQRKVTYNHSFVASLARHHKAPKPDLPPAAWKLMGRVVTEQELKAMMADWYKDQLRNNTLDLKLKYEREERELRDKAIKDYKRTHEYQRLIQCWDVVKTTLNLNDYASAEDVRRALLSVSVDSSAAKVLLPQEVEKLAEALDILRRATFPIVGRR